LHFAAQHGLSTSGLEAMRSIWPAAPDHGTAAGRSILNRAIAHVPDVRTDPGSKSGAVAEIANFRSVLGVPMMRDGLPIGAITVNRSQAGPFPDRQIALLQTFADQAVIAVQNVRLFQELETRNRDLTETLEQQTATGEILRVISSSPTDVQPVFETIVRSAARLCDARFALVYRLEDEIVKLVAHHNFPPSAVEQFQRTYAHRLSDGGSIAAHAMLRGEVVHVHDIEVHPDVSPPVLELARSTGYRTALAVPIMREGQPLGAIAVTRSDATGAPKPFSTAEIQLLKTFADQAVIAIENVRLFQELEARTQDLTRSVGELTALGEVSQAVSSTLDLETVLATIVSRAVQLSGSTSGIVYEYEETTEHSRSRHPSDHARVSRGAPRDADPDRRRRHGDGRGHPEARPGRGHPGRAAAGRAPGARASDPAGSALAPRHAFDPGWAAAGRSRDPAT
jgi:GAF domain-containing protein